MILLYYTLFLLFVNNTRHPLELMTRLSPKASLRTYYQELRNTISDLEHLESSQSICSQLLALPQIQAAHIVVGYFPIRGEMDIVPALQSLSLTKRIGFPRYISHQKGYDIANVQSFESEIHLGYMNIPEPIPSSPSISFQDIDIWLIPGIAFDPQGNRLGWGNGIYDRLLVNTPGTKIGIAHHTQYCNSLPIDSHDIAMDLVIYNQLKHN